VRTAREYLRVSKDRTGQQRSPDEQHSENFKAATAHHLVLGESYRETSAVSASRYSTKKRDAFGALMADLESGSFSAEVLILWESSRGSRRVGEWVDLIDILAEHDITVFVTTHGREYDPRNPRDRRSLLEDAVDSEYESGKTSQRVKRDLERNAAEGRPHGIIPFGYMRERDPRNGHMVKQVPDPAEVDVVREIFNRLYRGESLRAICLDFGTRGITTRTGKPWTESRMRQMVLSGAHAGLRIHDEDWKDPKKRRRFAGQDGMQVTPADWEAIVEKDVFWSVYNRLTAPERTTTRPGRARHLLSLIAACDPCGGPLTSKLRGGALFYICQAKGCVRIPEPELDAFVEQIVIAYLSREENYSSFAEKEQQGQELQQVRGDLAKLRAARSELADAVTKRGKSVSWAIAADEEYEKQITALERRERELVVPEALHALMEPGADVAARWDAAPMSARREIVKLLLSPGKAGQLRVSRNPLGKMHGPVRNRVRLDAAAAG
jgi:site-specific DNA recombinase